MTSEALMHSKVVQEMANFQKSMEELRLLRKVSQDLRKFKKMISLRRFD